MEPAEVGGAGDGVEMFLSRMAQRRSEPVFGVAPRAIVVSPMATTTANGAGPISSPWTPSSGGRQPRAQSGRIGTQRGSPYRSPHSDGGRAPAIVGQMSTMSPTGPHRTKFERRFSSPIALSKSNPASASLIMAEGRGSTQSFCAIQQPPYGLLRASGWHTHYSNMRRSSMSLMSADKDAGVLTWNRSTPSVTTSSTCQSLLVGDSSSVATTQMPQRSAHASTSSLTSRYADELRPPHEYLSIVQNNSQVLLEHVFANKTQVDSDSLAKASKSIDAVAVATLSTTPTSEGIVTTDTQSETRCSPIRLMAEEVTRHHWSARASAPMTAQRRGMTESSL